MFGRARPDPTTLLATATLGVYLLVVVGATASLADAAAACSSWPVCTAAASDPAAAVALGHHVMAALVGVVVLAASVALFRSETSRRVKATTGLALGLYPGQVVIGALLATTTTVPAGLHLVAGVAIFGILLVALAWHLEYETGDDDEPLDVADVEPLKAATVESMDAADVEPRNVADIEPRNVADIEPRNVADAESVTGSDEPLSPSDSDTLTPLADRPLGARLRARALAYVSLTKPRLMWLLCLVAAAAMALAAGSALTIQEVVLTLGGGVLAIGASGTFNHVLERDRDRKMARTNDRPLVRHEVPARNAIVFGLVLTVLSIGVFLQLNALTAALGLTAILFYSVIYTLVLKPNTVQNTVIGGAAGSLPALIGWAAVTGRIDVAALVLAGFIFVWTPAHFYNLALAYREDYARGGFPMMPVVRGETTTRKHILLWLGTTLAVATSLIWLTHLGWVTAVVTTVVGAVFLWAVVRLHREQTERAAFRAFHASNAYLGLVLVAIVVEALV